MAGRGGGESDYSRKTIIFKYFCQRGGDYLRETINGGTAIIRGITVSSLLDTEKSQYFAQPYETIFRYYFTCCVIMILFLVLEKKIYMYLCTTVL